MYSARLDDPLAEMAAKLAPAADGAPVDEAVSVTIDDPTRCPRYTARVIRGCKVGPSPDWMVERLAAIGQRSINNIVAAMPASRCPSSLSGASRQPTWKIFSQRE